MADYTTEFRVCTQRMIDQTHSEQNARAAKLQPDLVAYWTNVIRIVHPTVPAAKRPCAKRHLIKRLQQSPLSADHAARLGRLLRRAVLGGAGMQEFRAYRRLAGPLVLIGALPDLPGWLEEKAQGAILIASNADACVLADVHKKHGFGALEAMGWFSGQLYVDAKWGLPFPDLPPPFWHQRTRCRKTKSSITPI